MEAKERMWLTQDRSRLVKEGHPEAAILYATPGTEIPASAVEMFGLKGGRLAKSRAGSQDKAAEPDEDKAAEPEGDKAAEPEGDKPSGGGLTVTRRGKRRGVK